MQRFIVYTRPDRGVDVCAPSLTCMGFMGNGGGRWNDIIPHQPLGFLDRQIAEQAKHGVGERHARRFVMALHKGGCSSSEAYEIMRDRYCVHLGTGHELWDKEDFPDRWFRDAWRRSHNGGPIYIDMGAARKTQLRRIRAFAGRHGLELRWPYWRQLARRAETPEALRGLWPRDWEGCQ